MDVGKMWQQYLSSLGMTATGQGGGSFDVITPAVVKLMAQGYESLAPAVTIPSDAQAVADEAG